MARINIEEEAWKRIYKLRDYAECSVQEAVGTVACLWSESQDLIKTHGTKSEILVWANLHKISDQESEKWISSLENARFISLDKNGLYKIHGNEIQIESRVKHLAKSSKGGKALKKKLQELKKLKAGQGTATGTPQLSHRGLNTIQDNAIQFNATQDNSKQGNAIQNLGENENLRKPKRASAPEGTQAVIARYCELWKQRYNSSPPVGGKVAGQIKTLVKDFGVYKATQFIEAYLDMPDSWFVTKRHDIATLMQNLNAVAQFIETGRLFTKKEIQNLDSQNTLRNTLDAIERGEI